MCNYMTHYIYANYDRLLYKIYDATYVPSTIADYGLMVEVPLVNGLSKKIKYPVHF